MASVDQFIGTWQLVSQHTIHPDGTVCATRGSNPMGVLMYDAQGNMAVQLMRTDDKSGQHHDLREMATAIYEYHAYFGTYEVNESEQIIRHYVVGAAFPGYRHTVQERPYTLIDNTLTLRVFAPDNTKRVLVWRRVV